MLDLDLGDSVSCLAFPLLISEQRSTGPKTEPPFSLGVRHRTLWCATLSTSWRQIIDRFRSSASAPTDRKSSRIESVKDGPGKVIAIDRFIGHRPIFAFGNSDGDKDMLEWTASNEQGFIGLLHHTDEVREYAYDRNSEIGKLDRALDEATAKGWTVVDMKIDWRAIF